MRLVQAEAPRLGREAPVHLINKARQDFALDWLGRCDRQEQVACPVAQGRYITKLYADRQEQSGTHLRQRHAAKVAVTDDRLEPFSDIRMRFASAKTLAGPQRA